MENTEIKKAWTKMSRNIKKIGLDYTCVMNAKQMRLGTATIMIDYINDPAQQLAEIKSKMDDFTEAKKAARRNFDYMKRNRKTYDEIFIPAAIRDMKKYPENQRHIDYYNYCIGSVEAYDNGTYLEFEYERQKKMMQERRQDAIKHLEAMPTFEEQHQRSRERFEELMKSEPMKNFMEATGAKAIIEEQPDGNYTKIYARFAY